MLAPVCVCVKHRRTHAVLEIAANKCIHKYLKPPHDFIALMIFHRQLSLLLGIQVITMQAAAERVLKDVFLYGE